MCFRIPKWRRFLVFFLVMGVGGGGLTASLCAQTRSEQQTLALLRILSEELDIKNFQAPMHLKEALGLLMEKFDARGKELPIVVNRKAFRNNWKKITEAVIRMPYSPKRLTTADFLRLVLDQLPCDDAIYLVGPRYVEITTAREASLQNRLKQKVVLILVDRPLEDALDELFEQTGAGVTVDARAAEKAHKPLTAKLVNVSLGAAVRILADLAGLKSTIVDDGLYITTPEHCAELEKDARGLKGKRAKEKPGVNRR
jgi:hypothetical protein